MNPTENQVNTNQSEYAKKEPLVYKKTILKILKIALIVFLVIGIFTTASLIIINIINKINSRPAPSEPTEEVVEKPKEDIPTIAYIKNKKAVWVANIKGEDKRMVVEIPASSEQSFGALGWKDKSSITYSKCDDEKLQCSVETLNTNTKAITMELSDVKNGFIPRLKWSPKENYLAYINVENEYAEFKLKTGTVNNTFGNKFKTDNKSVDLSSRIVFSDDAQYVVFSGLKIYQIGKYGDRDYREERHSVVEVYKPNGVMVDSIEDASDPMLLDSQKIAYKKGSELFYKEIGVSGETKITSIQGLNPEVSFDKTKIAYWNEEGGFSNALLVVYESNRNIHRNILRGILLPTWVSNEKVAGIKAENCLGSNCQLYEFQTNSLAIVDIAMATVSQVDQGTSITQVNYNEWYAN